MAERAAELDSSEFDVVFSAAHMLRLAKLLTTVSLLEKSTPYRKLNGHIYPKKCRGFRIPIAAALLYQLWVYSVPLPFNNHL